MLPIRQILNALPTSALNRTAKAVLIEVCRLAELDAQGWCTAKNDYLVTCLGGTERTMTRALTLLEQRGLLQSTGKGKARRLAPTAGLRACYAGTTEADRHAALAALDLAAPSESATANLDKSGAQPRQNGFTNLDISAANLDKTGREPRQNDEVGEAEPRQKWSANLDKSGAQPRHFGSRVYGDQFNQEYTSPPPSACGCGGEREALQKKIADLESENRLLKAKIQELVPPVAQPPRPLPAAEAEPAPYSEASKAVAQQMAPLWHISQLPKHGGLWALLTRFTHQKEQAAQLEEVVRQFAGYRLHRQKRNLGPHALRDYLGSEGNGFEGIWCQYDWPTKAAQTRADGEAVHLTPVPRVATVNKFIND